MSSAYQLLRRDMRRTLRKDGHDDENDFTGYPWISQQTYVHICSTCCNLIMFSNWFNITCYVVWPCCSQLVWFTNQSYCGELRCLQSLSESGRSDRQWLWYALQQTRLQALGAMKVWGWFDPIQIFNTSRYEVKPTKWTDPILKHRFRGTGLICLIGLKRCTHEMGKFPVAVGVFNPW